MPQIDFEHNDYTLEDIEDIYTDGDFNNFKNDDDFLDFLLSYSLGDYIKGEGSEKYMEFAKYDGFPCILRLDDYDYFGDKIYKLYELCEKNKYKFMMVCSLIKGFDMDSINKDLMDINFRLKEAVPLIDDTLVLQSGLKPDFYPVGDVHYEDLTYDEKEEFWYEQERLFRKRINDSIQKNGDNLPLFKEMISYSEKKKIEQKLIEEEIMEDNYSLAINNLFYGRVEESSSKNGYIGSMGFVSWFENMNMNVLGYRVFRSIPDGEFYLLDKDGNVYDPERYFYYESVGIKPAPSIQKVGILSIKQLIRTKLNVLKKNPFENRDEIQNLYSILNLLDRKKEVLVGDLAALEPLVRSLYFDGINDSSSFENGDNDSSTYSKK